MKRPSRLVYCVLKAQAMAHLVLGRRSAALAVFGRLLHAWPDDAYALASRAHVLAQLQQPAQALADSTRLVALPQATARHWFNHGYLLEELGLLPEAVLAFTQATQRSPQLDRAWYGLGLALTRLGRLDEALAAFKRTTELQPMAPHAWVQLARLHLARNEPEQASKVMEHLRGFEPQTAAHLSKELASAAAQQPRALATAGAQAAPVPAPAPSP